jgi:hypothetical protein
MFKIEHVPKETKNLETNEQSQKTFILIITFSYYLDTRYSPFQLDNNLLMRKHLSLFAMFIFHRPSTLVKYSTCSRLATFLIFGVLMRMTFITVSP